MHFLLICFKFGLHEYLQETKENEGNIVTGVENQAKSKEREEPKGITGDKVLNGSHLYPFEK